MARNEKTPMSRKARAAQCADPSKLTRQEFTELLDLQGYDDWSLTLEPEKNERRKELLKKCGYIPMWEREQ